MDYIIFIAIVVVAVLAILFWPKREKAHWIMKMILILRRSGIAQNSMELKAQKEIYQETGTKANKPSKEDLKQKE